VIVRLLGGRGSSHEPEMTVRPSVGMAVQSPTVTVNVRVGLRHRLKLSAVTPAHLFSEVIATAGLLLVIFSLTRTKRAHIAPAAFAGLARIGHCGGPVSAALKVDRALLAHRDNDVGNALIQRSSAVSGLVGVALACEEVSLTAQPAFRRRPWKASATMAPRAACAKDDFRARRLRIGTRRLARGEAEALAFVASLTWSSSKVGVLVSSIGAPAAYRSRRCVGMFRLSPR